MRYLYPIFSGSLLTLVGLLSPIFMLIALPFIRWDKGVSTSDNYPHPVIRGDLPQMFKWLGTIDERLPGGLYEPVVESIYLKYGKVLCSWYWLGFRNKMHYLGTYVLGKPTDGPIDWVWGYHEQYGLWRYTKKLGKLRFVVGWQSYNNNGYWQARPVCTIKVL